MGWLRLRASFLVFRGWRREMGRFLPCADARIAGEGAMEDGLETMATLGRMSWGRPASVTRMWGSWAWEGTPMSRPEVVLGMPVWKPV